MWRGTQRVSGDTAKELRQECAALSCAVIHQEESWGLFRPVAAVQPAYFSPTAANAFCASGLLMNVFQTKLLRWFSAINLVIPASIPMTSGSYHPLSGLKASTNP